MDAYQRPSKEQIRQWQQERIKEHTPPPDQRVIKDQLWNSDRARKQALT